MSCFRFVYFDSVRIKYFLIKMNIERNRYGCRIWIQYFIKMRNRLLLVPHDSRKRVKFEHRNVIT